MLQIIAQWPDDVGVLYQVHRTLLWAGRVDAARPVYERWRSLAEGGPEGSPIPGARQDCAEGRRAPVEAALAGLPADELSVRWYLLLLLGRDAEAAQLLQPLEQSGQVYALSGFLAYPQFDPRPFPSLMQVPEREQVQRPAPEPIPFACPPAGPGS